MFRNKGEYNVIIFMLSDANHQNSSGQLGFVGCLLIGSFQQVTLFHSLNWLSKNSKRPVLSIGSAETIEAGIDIDEGNIHAMTFMSLLSVETLIRVCVYSINIWDSLPTCHEPSDKSIKDDVNVIRYEFEKKQVSWIT